MASSDLHSLFLHQLRDTYFAENAVIKASPEMIDAAQSTDLKSALGVHLEETREQVKRLDQIFKLLGEKAEGVECKAIQGILAEGEEIREAFSGTAVADAGLISAAQAIEHYEITRYGTLLSWATQLGLEEAATLLKETLIEEENTDEILSDIAESSANLEAA